MDETRKPRRRRFQFSLRSLFVVMTLVCIGMSWLGIKMQEARKQREAVEAIRGLGGAVSYDYEMAASGNGIQGAQPSSPQWLRKLFGDDFFANVTFVSLEGPSTTDAELDYIQGLNHLYILRLHFSGVTDQGLERIKGLTELRRLWLNKTRITDVGLEHLQGLTQLQELWLRDTRITDVGLKHLNGLAQLRHLMLDFTEVTDDGVKGLRQSGRRRYTLIETKIRLCSIYAFQPKASRGVILIWLYPHFLDADADLLIAPRMMAKKTHHETAMLVRKGLVVGIAIVTSLK